jgi:hypothetical protein
MEPKEPDITEVAHSLKDASTLTEPSKCVCSPADPQKVQDGEESCHTESSSIPEKGQGSPREEEGISSGKMEAAASVPVQSAEDISQSEQEAGLKSEDEGFDSLGSSSGVDSSSEDNLTDEKEPETEQRKEKDSPDSSEEEEDGGLGSEAAAEPPIASTATIAKSRSEKDIKNKILSILNEAKAKENDGRGGRTVRNYGRTFEQAVQLTPPVLANDKRPEKARRMDSLWCQSVARRQGTNFNGVEVAAKPVTARGVPWSQRANNAAVKKDSVIYNTEVEEFDKCRKNLETSKQAGKGAAAVAITVKPILKATSDSKERIRETKAPVKEQQLSSEKVTEEETPSTDISLKDKDIISDSAAVSSALCKEVVPSNQETEEGNLVVQESEDSPDKSITAVAESIGSSTAQLPEIPATDSTEKTSTQSSPDVPTAPLQKASDVHALPGPETFQAFPVRDATSLPVRNASAAPVRETSTLLVTPSTPITRRRADLGPSLLMPAPRTGMELKEKNSMSHSRKKRLQPL